MDRIRVKIVRSLAKTYRLVRDKLFPLQSKRRQLYSWLDMKVRLIIECGWVTVFDVKGRPYYLWMLKHEPSRRQLPEIRAESRSLPYRPLVSLVTPVFNPTRYALTQCIESVLSQMYDRWEWCIVDGGSNQRYVRKTIERFAQKDPRIKYVRLETNRGIAGNSNEALRLASGDYVGLLDHDDTLAPLALFEVVKALNKSPSLDFLYSDEDKVPAFGATRYDPEFKSGWAPDTFLSYNYLCHFAVVRKTLLDDVGGFREGFDGAQDYDLILRIVERTKNIERIPKVLYHWRASRKSTASHVSAKPYAAAAAKKAIAEHLSRRDIAAEVLDGRVVGTYRVRYGLRGRRSALIIIPTKDKVELLRRCVSSVLEKTTYADFKILIVDNGSDEKETLEYLGRVTQDSRVRVLPYRHPFNFSAINNDAVRADDSEYLMFLNNDTEVMNSDWLASMAEFAQREDVGAVGAKLYYPDNSVQHSGVIVGLGGVAGHAFKGFARTAHGYMGRIDIIQNLSAVTAACLLMRRAVFDEVGGFDERLSHCFNDVDLCLRIRERGYLVVYTPYAELYHHESVSRGFDETPEAKARLANEVEFMKTRWKSVLVDGDPYYSPNLTLFHTNFGMDL